MSTNNKGSVGISTLTHATLIKVIKGINEQPERVVVITQNSKEKPVMHLHSDLVASTCNKQADKRGYISQETGYPVETILLVLTREVIERYERLMNTKSVARLEKEIYAWLVD